MSKMGLMIESTSSLLGGTNEIRHMKCLAPYIALTSSYQDNISNNTNRSTITAANIKQLAVGWSLSDQMFDSSACSMLAWLPLSSPEFLIGFLESGCAWFLINLNISHSSFHLFVSTPYTQPPNYPDIQPPIYLLTYPSGHSLAHSSIFLSISSMYSTQYPSFHPLIHSPTICPCIYPPI